MQYLLLIYQNEAEMAKRTPAAAKVITEEYRILIQSLVGSGHFKGADRLRGTSTASTVRVHNGKTVVSDGPFAETREQLGGYMMVEAKDLDEACAIAARIPGAKEGCVEVRPVWPQGEY